MSFVLGGHDQFNLVSGKEGCLGGEDNVIEAIRETARAAMSITSGAGKVVALTMTFKLAGQLHRWIRFLPLAIEKGWSTSQ